MRYLNTNKQFENYKELVNEEYFVDKSMIIKMLNEKISTKSKYICITRPRRFGKSSIADMLGAYYIKKYSSGSALNMFDEYTFLKDRNFGEYFGFVEEEVIELCNRNGKMNFKELESWYNGYFTATGIRVYNPRSVVKALQNNYCESYWTNTGAMDEVSEYLKYNILEIRDEVIEMVAGEEIDVIIKEEFRAGQGTPKTKKEIYSAMIVLGFLSYYEGYLKIPNKELMLEFEKALEDESFGYVSKIIENLKSMLKATVNKDVKIIE